MKPVRVPRVLLVEAWRRSPARLRLLLALTSPRLSSVLCNDLGMLTDNLGHGTRTHVFYAIELGNDDVERPFLHLQRDRAPRRSCQADWGLR